jgi:hypothetical protein
VKVGPSVGAAVGTGAGAAVKVGLSVGAAVGTGAGAAVMWWHQ